jgi:hypothetical protein
MAFKTTAASSGMSWHSIRIIPDSVLRSRTQRCDASSQVSLPRMPFTARR